ncbi:MAG: hypothetical protein ACFFFC_05345 [Candidatus Thorarchaeota archaeon]
MCPAENRRSSVAKSSVVTLILAIIAVIGPIAVYPAGSSVGNLSYQVIAFPWQIIDNTLILLNPFRMSIFFPLVIPRPAFSYMLIRYYKGNTTRGRAIFIGLLSELQIVALSISMILVRGLYPIGSYIQVALPFPLLFVVGLILLLFHKKQEPTTSWDESKD